MAAHTECVAGDFYGKHFLLLYVVVDRAAIDINNLGRTSNSDDFDVFAAAVTPDFLSVNEGRLQFGHLFTICFGRRAPANLESQSILCSPRLPLQNGVRSFLKLVAKMPTFLESINWSTFIRSF